MDDEKKNGLRAGWDLGSFLLMLLVTLVIAASLLGCPYVFFVHWVMSGWRLD